MTRKNTDNDFWKKVRAGKSRECWEWMAGKMSRGYGTFSFQGTNRLAHRLAYKFTHGSIPKGKYIIHSCDNKSCCNPAHLRAGTQKDNMRDMIERGRANKAKGEESGMSKLSEVDVKKIRKLYATEKLTLTSLGKRFNVNHTNIHLIVTRSTWKHI